MLLNKGNENQLMSTICIKFSVTLVKLEQDLQENHLEMRSQVQYADFQEEENKAERYCWEYIACNLKELTLKLFREAK